jgi:hypothetical protein
MPDYIRQLWARIENMKILILGIRGLLFDDDGRPLLQKRDGCHRPSSLVVISGS